MLRNTVEQDLAKALNDIEAEKTSKPSELISGHPSSQAILLAKKRQDRMRDGHSLHAFLLTQTSKDRTEFNEFIEKLKAAAPQIKPGTRILLNVITTYVDEEFDKDLYDAGRRECAHWTPIDLLVEDDHSISSVILDASDTFGFRRMHKELKEAFPGKEHFMLRSDFTPDGKSRRIQTQPVGCRVFSVEHIKQLTQIPAKELRAEVRAISDKDGIYTPGSMQADSKILRVLRGMQTVTGFMSLTPEVRRSPAFGRKTLQQETDLQIDGRINRMVEIRSSKYKIKKREYVELLAPGELQMIMETKSGFEYLHYPVLFALSDKLALASRESVDAMLKHLQEQCEALNIDSKIVGFTDAGLSNECLKSKLLFRLESSFMNLPEDQSQQLVKLINAAMPILKQSTSPLKTYLSPDRFFAEKKGRSSRQERHPQSSSAHASPVASPVTTPQAPRITVNSNSSEAIKPPTLNFPK